MARIIFHIDVNSAFLSWTAVEQLKNGSKVDLREIPAIIGGDQSSRHGIVLAKSSLAKSYGIQTGEPVVNAFRKCPNLVTAPPNHKMYREKSRMLMGFLRTYTKKIEQVSVDECYMDFTPIAYRYPDPVTAAGQIKDSVRDTFGFTVNIGISDRKVLAKMASDFKKPDLVHTLFHTEIRQKMWPLPISSLFLCGRSSVEVLHNLGILTIGDLAQADESIIVSHLKSHGRILWEFANGIDASAVETTRMDAKGVGNSTTMTKDAVSLEEINTVLLSLSESVAVRLRRANVRASMVSVEIKYNTFQSVSHQTTLATPSDSSSQLYQTACRLAAEIWDGTPVRLLGIRTSKLVDASAPVQMSIFDLPQQKTSHDLEAALDSIRKKYGDDAVVRGSLLRKPK